MKTPMTLIALSACLMLLAACEKTTPAPPTPMLTQPVAAEPGATTDVAAQPSVPSAASVLPPLNADPVDPALGETDGTRKPKLASDEQLLPGQNNDHSAPLSPAAQ